jgi:hypothetical protein
MSKGGEIIDPKEAYALIPEVKANWRELVKSGKESVKYAMQIGELLIRMKEHLKHGEFQKTIEERFDFSYDTARNWMKLAKELPPILKSLNGDKVAQDLSLRGSLRLITTSKKSKDERAQLLTDQCGNAPVKSPVVNSAKVAGAGGASAGLVRPAPADSKETGTAATSSNIKGGVAFDVAEIEAKSKAKNGSVAKTTFDDKAVVEAYRLLVRGLDEFYDDILKLYHDRKEMVGGVGYGNAVQAANKSLKASHLAANEAMQAFKAWSGA